MKIVQVIIHFCLSALFVLTPILGFSAEINHAPPSIEESCCGETCDMKDDTMDVCDHSDTTHTKDDCKDKCQDSCHDHASHVVPLTIKPPISRAHEPATFVLSLKQKNRFYQDLSLQNFIFQFWNPPKLG